MSVVYTSKFGADEAIAVASPNPIDRLEYMHAEGVVGLEYLGYRRHAWVG